MPVALAGAAPLPARAAPRLLLEGGPALLAGVGGDVGAAPLLSLRASLMFGAGRHFGITARALLPILSARGTSVDEMNGVVGWARVVTGGFTTGLRWQTSRPTARLQPTLEAGLGAYYARMRTYYPWGTSGSGGLTVAHYVSGGLALMLTRALRLRADLVGSIGWPSGTTYGPLQVLASTGIELAF